MKRWKAVVYYRTDAGIVDVTHEIEELDELHYLVERGPHWDTIDHIRIDLARPAEAARMTVEQAAQV